MSDAGGPGDRGEDHPRGEQVGSVSEEALKLMGALSGWAREHGSDLGAGLGDLADQASAAARGVDGLLEEHLATGAPECTWCPVCRTVHLVRQTSPEVRAHLAVAASSLLQAAAGLLATAVPDDARERAGGVERIDLDHDAGHDAGHDAEQKTDGDWPGEDDA